MVLSLDGRKEVNDRFRIDYNGNGSYDNIVPKFKKFVEARKGKDYYNNVDLSKESLPNPLLLTNDEILIMRKNNYSDYMLRASMEEVA